jgi:hypothetical protein
LSTARYKYFHFPLTFTYVSSIRQLVPTRRSRFSALLQRKAPIRQAGRAPAPASA